MRKVFIDASNALREKDYYIKKEINHSVFRQWKKEQAKFLVEFENEKKRRVKKFIIEELPEEIVKKFYKHMESLGYHRETDNALIIESLKLAWCYANDMYYIPPGDSALVLPEIGFNYDIFEEVHDKIGVPTLETIIDNLCLLKFIYQLGKDNFKDPSFAKGKREHYERWFKLLSQL